MSALILVFVGGAIGSMWRFWWSGLVAQRIGETFPFGTLVINLAGSLLIGAISGGISHGGHAAWALPLQHFAVAGICGGLTTFSSFSLQTWNLITERRWLAALANILFSTALCLGAVAIGWRIGQAA